MRARRILATAAAVGALMTLSVGSALAHPLTPPGEAHGAPPGLPVPADNGHDGIHCAHEAGAQAIGDADFTCAANR